MAVVERAFKNTQVAWRNSDVIKALAARVGGPASPLSSEHRRPADVEDPHVDRIESIYAVPGAPSAPALPSFRLFDDGGLGFDFGDFPIHDDPGDGPTLLGDPDRCTGPISITAHPVVLLIPPRPPRDGVPGPGIPYAQAVCAVLLLGHGGARDRYVLRSTAEHQWVSRSDLPAEAIDPEATAAARTAAMLAWAAGDVGPFRQLYTMLRTELQQYDGSGGSHVAVPVSTGSPENLAVARAVDVLGAAFVRLFAVDVARDMVAGQLLLTALTMARRRIVAFPLIEPGLGRLRPTLHASTLQIGDSVCKVVDPDDCMAYEAQVHPADRSEWPVIGAPKAVQRVYFSTLAMGEAEDTEVPFRKRRRVEHPFRPT